MFSQAIIVVFVQLPHSPAVTPSLLQDKKNVTAHLLKILALKVRKRVSYPNSPLA
jgi:hypothetical protein